jgi:hypothetical protein
MKKRILIILLSAYLFSCSSKIGSTIISKQNPLLENEYVLVIDLSDPFINDGIKIGTLKSSDNGFSTNCNYDEIIENLKKLCRQNGANILNIIEHKKPDQWSSCDRVEAIIYKVPDYKIHEKQIEWSENRKLTWSDFKGKENIKDFNASAETSCELGLKSNSVKILGKTAISVTNMFECNLSWVLPKSKNNNDLLEHEQLHFDLNEIYARQLRKKIIETKFSYFNLIKESNKIYEEISLLNIKRQELYDSETNHGTESIAQKRWEKDIKTELNELVAYSAN